MLTIGIIVFMALWIAGLIAWNNCLRDQYKAMERTWKERCQATRNRCDDLVVERGRLHCEINLLTKALDIQEARFKSLKNTLRNAIRDSPDELDADLERGENAAA